MASHQVINQCPGGWPSLMPGAPGAPSFRRDCAGLPGAAPVFSIPHDIDWWPVPLRSKGRDSRKLSRFALLHGSLRQQGKRALRRAYFIARCTPEALGGRAAALYVPRQRTTENLLPYCRRLARSLRSAIRLCVAPTAGWPSLFALFAKGWGNNYLTLTNSPTLRQHRAKAQTTPPAVRFYRGGTPRCYNS